MLQKNIFLYHWNLLCGNWLQSILSWLSCWVNTYKKMQPWVSFPRFLSNIVIVKIMNLCSMDRNMTCNFFNTARFFICLWAMFYTKEKKIVRHIAQTIRDEDTTNYNINTKYDAIFFLRSTKLHTNTHNHSWFALYIHIAWTLHDKR